MGKVFECKKTTKEFFSRSDKASPWYQDLFDAFDNLSPDERFQFFCNSTACVIKHGEINDTLLRHELRENQRKINEYEHSERMREAQKDNNTTPQYPPVPLNETRHEPSKADTKDSAPINTSITLTNRLLSLMITCSLALGYLITTYAPFGV